MRRVLPSLLAVVVLLIPVVRVRAADDDAKAILAKAIKAHGGEESLSKYKASTSKSKGKLTLPGVGEVDFTQEVSVMQPDKFKESMDLEIGGQALKVITIANGAKSSINANGKDVEVTDLIKDALKEAQYTMKAARLTDLAKNKAYELSALGEIKVEGKPAVGIRVASKGHKDLNLYFDKETGLLAKVERRATDPQSGNEFTEERIILEYTKPDKDGLRAPKKVIVKRDGEKFMEAEVSEAKYLEKLDDSEFEIKK